MASDAWVWALCSPWSCLQAPCAWGAGLVGAAFTSARARASGLAPDAWVRVLRNLDFGRGAFEEGRREAVPAVAIAGVEAASALVAQQVWAQRRQGAPARPQQHGLTGTGCPQGWEITRACTPPGAPATSAPPALVQARWPTCWLRVRVREASAGIAHPPALILAPPGPPRPTHLHKSPPPRLAQAHPPAQVTHPQAHPGPPTCTGPRMAPRCQSTRSTSSGTWSAGSGSPSCAPRPRRAARPAGAHGF